MTDLKIFESPEFGTVRTVTINGEPWLVGKDVAEALGYSNTRDALDRHVDTEDKNTVSNPDGKHGPAGSERCTARAIGGDNGAASERVCGGHQDGCAQV